MVRIPLREGRTLHHDVKGRFGAGKVICRAAPPGTGIIAGGPMRAVFRSLGVRMWLQNLMVHKTPIIWSKPQWTLHRLQSPRAVAARRGKRSGRDPAIPDS